MEPTAAPAVRRRRPFRLILALVAVVAMVGGAAVAVLTAIRVSPPTEVVGKYFAALRAGDARAALSYGVTPAGNHSFLTTAALSAQNRLAAMGSVQVDVATVSGRTARVPVTYTLTPAAAPTRPSIQTTDVGLHRQGRGWASTAPQPSSGCCPSAPQVEPPWPARPFPPGRSRCSRASCRCVTTRT